MDTDVFEADGGYKEKFYNRDSITVNGCSVDKT